MFSIIVATTLNNIIGAEGVVPWNCTEDLKLFKKRTMHKVCIMGRLTSASIPGGYLKQRTNLILSSTLKPTEGFSERYIFNYWEDILEFCSKVTDEIFVCGGQSIYDYVLEKNLVNKIYHSIIHDTEGVVGDKFFRYDENKFRLISRETRNTFTLETLECRK